MKLSILLRMVFINILENKTKLLLTSLGIIVGAATIVLVIAIGQGSKTEVAEQFKNLNAGAIEIKVTTSNSSMMDEMMKAMQSGKRPSGGGMPSGMGGNKNNMGGMSGGNNPVATIKKDTLTDEDVTTINTFVTGLSDVSMWQTTKTDVLGGNLDEAESQNVAGVASNYTAVSNLSTLVGEFISDDNNSNNDKVCVIGYSLAEEMFTYPQLAFGDYLDIGGKNYEIIGILNEMGNVSSGINPDEAVYIPYNTYNKYVTGGSSDPSITAIAEDTNNVTQIISNINSVLTTSHPNTKFQITDTGSAMKAATSSADTLSILLFSVATIVFIVGGIGIMNVMFVSVKERTSEIGLLKALGYAKKTILYLFLLEAGFISVIGGILGAVLSAGLIPLMSAFNVRAEPTVFAYIVALFFSIVTGTCFGFYPAWKASNLVPIEALNL